MSKRTLPAPPPPVVYIGITELCTRYSRSRQWVVNMLARDPRFPKPLKFNAQGYRMWKLEEIEQYDAHLTRVRDEELGQTDGSVREVA